MAIFEITQESMTALTETSFCVEGIYERNDLQRHLKQNIRVLSDDLMVISEEYGDWVDSNRRIDLLCIDRTANIVVVEIKRTDDGGHMELQAIRYAAMLSAMTFEQLVDAHAADIRASGKTVEDAKAAILSFLKWNEVTEDAFADDVRIILAAADFSKEITTSVMWLREYGIDIRCIRLKPYKLVEGRILMDVQQIIPLPEASDYQTKIRVKQQAERENRVELHEIRYQFWSDLLIYAQNETPLFSGKNPTSAGGFGISLGKRGLLLGFLTRGYDSEVDLEITGSNLDSALAIYQHFEQHRLQINETFGSDLVWDQVTGRRACHVRSVVLGGWKSTKEEWPRIHKDLIDKVIKLEAVMRPYIDTIPG